jgi:polyphosphate kinase 2 (PPK2 family)
MLHISKEEQKQRLQDRLDDPTKNWKWNSGDLEDRARWSEFQDAYEVMLNRCSTAAAPWWVIPADSKWRRNVFIAQIVRSTLTAMNPVYPPPGPDMAGITIPD